MVKEKSALNPTDKKKSKMSFSHNLVIPDLEYSLKFLLELWHHYNHVSLSTKISKIIFIKILRHSSLHHNMKNENPKFRTWRWYIKRDISVQKLLRKNDIFDFVQLSFFKYPYHLNFVSIITFLEKLAFN